MHQNLIKPASLLATFILLAGCHRDSGGLAAGTTAVQVHVAPTREEHPLNFWTSQAVNHSERLIAAATLEKATAGVRAARQAYQL